MRHGKTWFGAVTAIAAAVATTHFSCADGDVDGAGDCTELVNGGCVPPGGSGGASGASGTGGGGAGGAPQMGTGGGGMGGAGGSGGCEDDAACAPAQGSLCIGAACSKRSGQCDEAVRVVVERADDALASAESRDACFYRALAPALTGTASGTRVAAYAATAVRASGPVTVPAGVRLEGHAAEAGKAVTLAVTAPIAGAPLVTMAAGSALAGFALDGGGTARGVAASTGAVRLEGPLRIAATQLALELTGDAVATVRGGNGTPPVVLTGNVRGIDVAQTAGLDLQGDGEAGGVLVETTGMAAGILLRAGDTSFENKLVGLLAKDNAGTSVLNGTGAVEVRQGRKVTVTGCFFRKNIRGINLNGENTSASDSFGSVVIASSTFETPSMTTGTAVCGTGFTGVTQLVLGNGNVFPSGRQTPADCTTLGEVANQGGACNGGNDLSVLDLAEPFDLSTSCGT